MGNESNTCLVCGVAWDGDLPTCVHPIAQQQRFVTDLVWAYGLVSAKIQERTSFGAPWCATERAHLAGSQARLKARLADARIYV